MYLKLRQREIIQKCMLHPDTTVQELGQIYKVSRRTVYDDIACIKDWAIENGILFERDSRRLFEIRDPDSLNRTRELLKEMEPFAAPLNQCSRINLILACLFFEDGSFTILQICEKIGISRSTFYRDLDAVVIWLEPFDLRLEIRKNRGVRILGRESRQRDAMVYFLKSNFDSVDLLRMLQRGKEDVFFSNEKDYIFSMVKRYFRDADVQTAVREIKGLQGEEWEKDYHLIYFIWLVLISGQREKAGFRIEDGEDGGGKEEVKEALGRLGFGEEERNFLSRYFKTMHTKKQGTGEEEKAVEERIRVFLERMSGLTDCPLRQDPLLEESLRLHIKTTINRLAMGIRDVNPLLEEIKSKYPELFHTCGLEIQAENLFGTAVGENEISYVVIYIAAAMERIGKSRKKVYAVCTTGKGNAQLLEAGLKKHFPEIEVLGTISMETASGLKETEADAIISTAHFDGPEIPVIRVSPLMLPQDISGIRQKLKLRPAENGEPVRTEETEADGFFQMMYMLSDCASAIEELTGLLDLELSNTVYIALLIHLMMQLHQGIGGKEADTEGLTEEEKKVYQVTDRLYRKYGRHVSRYDLDSIRIYIQRKEKEL